MNLISLINKMRVVLESGTYGNSALKTLIDTLTTNLATANAYLSGSLRGAPAPYPSLAAGVALAGGAGAWERGAWTEVVPAAGITTGYIPYAVVVEAITGTHQLELASGLAAAEVSLGGYKVLTTGIHILQFGRLAANTRLSMRTASLAGGAQAITVHIIYKPATA